MIAPAVAAGDSAPFGIVVLDASGRIEHLNPYMQRHGHCAPADVQGVPVWQVFDVLDGQGQPIDEQHPATLSADGLVACGELRLRARTRPDTTELRTLVSYRVPATDATDQPAHQVWLCHASDDPGQLHPGFATALLDLREARAEQHRLSQEMARVKEHLLQSGKLAGIGQLAAGVAHEINNPIGYVFSNLQSLASYVRDLLRIVDAIDRAESVQELHQLKVAMEYNYIRADVADLIAESGEGIDRVKQIITALKDFSHISMDGFKPADLHRSIDSTLNLANNEVKYKAGIVRDYAPDLPWVDCDISQIKQVVLNLVVNAAQAIPDRGTITIRTGWAGDFVWFEVEDTGSGMTTDVRERVFEPFFTTKPVGQGTGLGLALSFSIVQKHQGRIDVDTTPGTGTCIRVTLPRHHADTGS